METLHPRAASRCLSWVGTGTSVILRGIVIGSSGPREHPVQTQDVRYSEGGVEFLGYLAFDGTAPDKRPGILVVHEGLGLGEHIMERARRVAKLGYVVFAPDMFGGRVVASGHRFPVAEVDIQEMSKHLSDLRNDLPTLRRKSASRHLQRWSPSRKWTERGSRPSDFVSAVRSCSSLRAMAPTSRLSSACTVFSRRGLLPRPAR